MADRVAKHYAGGGNLASAIAESLRSAGKDIARLTTADLGTVDEFHVRGRKATLELAQSLDPAAGSEVLDIGSGLGGPARALAETYGCRVTGIDLTQAFCDAAATLSGWVGLADRVTFQQGDATSLPFADSRFDAAMTIHVAMNIASKDKMYAEARRVLKPGARFGIYDILQGEGGEVLFPVPWAREPSISHLATPDAMRSLLARAGFKIVDVHDSTQESQQWFEAMAARMAQSVAPVVTFQTFLGEDFPEMARNQVKNLTDRRIRTVRYVCEA
jgi:ubiquinone/menaquinone biosynthesis C-methylase UbiE